MVLMLFSVASGISDEGVAIARRRVSARVAVAAVVCVASLIGLAAPTMAHAAPLFPVADMGIVKDDGKARTPAGAPDSYTITVINIGPDTAPASWSDILPASLTFLSLSQPAGWSCSTPAVGASGSVSCSTANAPVGVAGFTLTVQFGGSIAGPVLNLATVTTDTDPNLGNNVAADGTAFEPALTIADATVTEGNSGTTDASFVVSIPTPSSETVSVGYATSDRSAQAPGDYSATSGTATIPPGATQTIVTVPLKGDTLLEADEQFAVTLASASNATIADDTATGTIVNDDTTTPPPPGGTPPAPPPGDRTAPVIVSASLNRTRFAVGPAATPVAAGSKATKRGATIRYSVSEPATAMLRIKRLRPGRRNRGRCVRETPRLRRKPRCTRATAVSTLTRRHTRAGLQKVAFSGRIGRRALARGKYQVVIGARDAAGNSARPRTLKFQIVR
jgi:uncharacterized repeat protein (TIGR01451 family)